MICMCICLFGSWQISSKFVMALCLQTKYCLKNIKSIENSENVMTTFLLYVCIYMVSWTYNEGFSLGDHHQARAGARGAVQQVRQQLPQRQEDLLASGGAGQARRSSHAEDSHPRILVPAYKNQQEDEADRFRDRGAPEGHHRQEGERAENGEHNQRRPPQPAAGIQHGALQGQRRFMKQLANQFNTKQ